MGTCSSNSKNKKENVATEISTRGSTESNAYEDVINKDMPEWDGERYKGVGIKRMKGYKCDIPINELNKLREEFWNSKINSFTIWKSIRQACAMDDIRAANIINGAGLKTLSGCLNHLKDSRGKIYRIPNYCINDPYFEKFIESEDSDKLPFNRTQKPIKIFVYNLYLNKKLELNTNDNISGKELKELYCSLENLNYDDYNLRLFFGGAEVLNDHRLYRHYIKTNFTLQIMMTEKEKEEEKLIDKEIE
jgi:hypothetical protein